MTLRSEPVPSAETGKPKRPLLDRVATAGVVALLTAPVVGAGSVSAQEWTASWTASPQPVWDETFVLPTNIPASLSNQTIRQIARVSLGGRRVRVVLSNVYGKEPLVIGGAHVGLAGPDFTIVAGSHRKLTFGGRESVMVPPGAPVLSDPVELSVSALSEVAVSLFLPEPTALTTFHWDGRRTAAIASGNRVAAARIEPENAVDARVFLSGLLVDAPSGSRTVAAFGDSITDGNGSTPNADRRWPDFLARRLAKEGVAVINAGISGARVLKTGMGENALARFERDVLGKPGVKTVIVLMGINDIGWPGGPFAPEDPALRAEDLIAGYRQLIARAHTHGVRIIGATLTPFEDALKGTPLEGHHSPEKEETRQRVNAWIRTSGAFDAVADFDAATRDPEHPTRFLPAFDSGDHLHPGDAGYEAMAEAIDLTTLFAEP